MTPQTKHDMGLAAILLAVGVAIVLWLTLVWQPSSYDRTGLAWVWFWRW